MTIESLALQVRAQKKIIRRGSMLITALFLLIGFFILTSFEKNNDRGIIRAKGIVIMDENGRDRILIGAPFPPSAQRIRTDFEKSKQAWGKRFNGDFEWYQTNRSITNNGAGILIMDENGHDRVTLGAPSPSSWIGRIAPLTGITVNDEEGSERGGFGLIKGKQFDRMVIGLDHSTGNEGATLAVLEDGSTSLSLSEPDHSNRIQLLNDKGIISEREGIPPHMSGLLLRDAKGNVKTLLNAAPQMPVLLLKDTADVKPRR